MAENKALKEVLNGLVKDVKKENDQVKSAYEKKQKEWERLEKQHKLNKLKQQLANSGLTLELYQKIKYLKLEKNKYNIKVFKEINDWLKGKRKEKPFLILWGNYGTGKTTFALRIGIMKFDKDRQLIFVRKKDFDVKITNFEDINTYEYLKTLKEIDLLIIDDILSGYLSDYRFSQLFDVLDYRYMLGKETIITANEDLLNFNLKGNSDWARLQDRLYEVGYFVEFNMMSYRRMKHQITSNK